MSMTTTGDSIYVFECEYGCGCKQVKKKKKPKDISNTWSHYILWLHGNHRTLVVENVVILSFCERVSMKYPLANAASCIGVKNLSNTCVRTKIYSVMKKCESKTMPYILHDASCLLSQ